MTQLTRTFIISGTKESVEEYQARCQYPRVMAGKATKVDRFRTDVDGNPHLDGPALQVSITYEEKLED